MLSPMAQDAAPMPIRSSRVPTVRAATLGLEQHDAVRTPATDTKLRSLPGLSSAQQGLGTGPAPCQGMESTLSGLGLRCLKPHFPGLGSWQGCPVLVSWTARCLAPQGFQLGRGYGSGGCQLPPPWLVLAQFFLSSDMALLDFFGCLLLACPQTLFQKFLQL